MYMINSMFQDLVRKQVVQMTSGSVTKVVLENEANMKRPEYPKPDTSQMFPFKPKILLGETLFSNCYLTSYLCTSHL